MKIVFAALALLLTGAVPAAIEFGRIALEGRPAQGALLRGTAPAGTASLEMDGVPIPMAPDGRFLLGFSREASLSATLVATSAEGMRTVLPLTIARTPWPTRNLRTLPKNTPRTPQAIARRAAEVARVDAARGALQPVEGWRRPFRWPVTGRISGVFGAQTIYAGEPGSAHGGVDIARPAGTPVAAPADSIVVLASPPQFSVEGNLLILDHGMGLSSAFLHLSRIDVPVGARVRQGQIVGAIGTTGRSTGPHLHWGLVWRPGRGEGVRVDPRPFAGPMFAGS